MQLIRAHPELAGKAMVSKTLTAESTNEQGKAGLTDCTPQEFATIQRLNTEYNERFGFPFILAVRGPRGTGLSKQEIIATFARRVRHHPDFELAEALRVSPAAVSTSSATPLSAVRLRRSRRRLRAEARLHVGSR